MSIKPYGNKKNQYRIWISAGKDPVSGKRLRVTEVFKGKITAARKRERALEAQLDRGDYIERKTDTLSDYAALWYPKMQGGLAPTTIANCTRLLNNHVIPQFGNVQLQKISAANISDFLGTYLSREKIDGRTPVRVSQNLFQGGYRR